MGWAVRRADGSFRCWSRNAPDDSLRAGETHVELPDPPTLTPDVPTPAEIDAGAVGRFDDKALKALALVMRDELNVIRAAMVTPLPPLTVAELRQAFIDKYKALP
jgi:hypothetical protein